MVKEIFYFISCSNSSNKYSGNIIKVIIDINFGVLLTIANILIVVCVKLH